MAKQTIIPPSAVLDGPIIYGGFMDRFIALIIDCLLLYIVQLLFLSPLTAHLLDILGITSSFFVTEMKGGLSYFSSFMVVCWLYFACFESSVRGATLGKMAMALRVVDEDGLQISFKTASIRFIFKLVSKFILMLGFLMALFSFKRQALHDKVARTIVVAVPEE